MLANPLESSQPNVTHLSNGGMSVAWTIPLSVNVTSTGAPQFEVSATFSLLPGADSISERVTVTRLRKSVTTHAIFTAICFSGRTSHYLWHIAYVISQSDGAFEAFRGAKSGSRSFSIGFTIRLIYRI